jgi:hypothetical protein
MLPLPIRAQAIAARKRRESADDKAHQAERRVVRLSAEAWFFLRATAHGYDLDRDLSIEHPLTTARKRP